MKKKKKIILTDIFVLTDPALVANNPVAVIMNGALGNVVSEVGFGHLVARV